MKLIDTSKLKETTTTSLTFPENILVLSHLRWDFVYQRPQHLLTRFAKQCKITFLEEPLFDAPDKGYYTFSKRDENIVVVTPHVRDGLEAEELKEVLKALFNEYMQNKTLANYAFWYYTPMALEFSRKYIPDMVIYDCMDELSAFKFAPPRLKALEQELLKISDVVFTGGHSLYEAKKNQHANIHPFPSSIDKKHFAKARSIKSSPPDQIATQQPKLGFYGVIDERFDVDLIKGIADARPDWQIILIGPVVKIDQNILPKNSNIHYLGPKSYQELPTYMADWNIALIPFLLNESTRFISPTKTPEYLAAGLPVISTAIKDVIDPYGKRKLVQTGNDANDFILAAEKLLALTPEQRVQKLNKVDHFLSLNSWDKTCDDMMEVMKNTLAHKSEPSFVQGI
jgi:glycosyltransferase involved in cell wall biosynthesis